MSARPPSPDVVVIGAGVIGCAAALSLTRRGLRVHVVERGGVSSGTTGCCMGHLMVTPSPPFFLDMTRRSVLRWRELAHEVPGLELRDTGCLWLAEEARDLALLDDVQRMFAGAGEGCERLDPAGLAAREPGLARDLAGGLWYPRDAVVMPMMATGALLAAAMAQGCSVETQCEVTGVRRGGGGRIEAVRTTRGEVATRTVVCCTGVWAPLLTHALGLPRLPIFPRRGDLAVTAPLGCSVRTQMLEVSYLRTAGGKAKVDPESGEPDPGAHAMNIQPQTHDTIVIGSTRQFGGYAREVNRDLLRFSLQRAARFVPELARASVVRTWAGLRPYPRDKLPLIGPMAALPGFFVASGHEGLGITLAPITGELIADLVCGGEPCLDPAPVAPDRFLAVPT